MELRTIFKYRNIWMGMAILWILLFHSGIIIANPVINFMKITGYGGVDIFLFASGLGCYYSLKRNLNLADFFTKRFGKLMPTYWCFLVFWIVYKSFNGGICFNEVVGNIFCIQNFTGNGNDFNWYISAIWLLYLLAPWFFSWIERMESQKSCMAVTFVLVLFSFAFWNSHTFIITVSRFPIFFMGMFMAKEADKGARISMPGFTASLAAMAAGVVALWYCRETHHNLLWDYGLWWYPFILITPGLCFLISGVAQQMEKSSIGKRVLGIVSVIGNDTFEIYLVHMLLFDIYENDLIANNILPDKTIYWLVTILAIIPGCMFLKRITAAVTGVIKHQ